MMRKLNLLLTGWLLFSCTNNQENGNSRENNGEETTTIAPVPTPVKPEGSAFLNYLTAADSSFATDHFTITEEATIDPLPAAPLDTTRLQGFKDLLIYNKDRSKAVDLFSYSYIVHNKDGIRYAEAGEPDTEVALIDFDNKTRKRLLFVGPAFSIADATWLDSTSVQLYGGEEISEGKLKPTIWKIDVTNNTVETYTTNDTVNVNVGAFLDRNFKGIKFK